MARTLLNLIVDLAAALAMLVMLLTGYILRFPLPPGTNKEWMLWSLTRHGWGEVHAWIGLALAAVILGHLILHWTWIVTVLRQRLGCAKPDDRVQRRDAVLTAFMLVLGFAMFAGIAHRSVERVPVSHAEACGPDESVSASRLSTEGVAANDVKPRPTWSDVAPIFERACTGCHGPRKQAGQIRLDRVEELLSGDAKAWVIPGRSQDSPLMDIVTGRRDIALPERHRLPDSEVARLRAWIDAGAASHP